MYYEKYLNKVYTSSGWASDLELIDSQGCMKGTWHKRPQEGGVVLYSRDGDVIVDGGKECRHVLIIGVTGTGKSRLIIIPSILFSLLAEQKRSFVIFDVKGELQNATVDLAKECGYKIININFRNPVEGECWNPFYRVNELYATGKKENQEKAWRLLEEIIASIFNDGNANRVDPYWRNICSDLFRGICNVLFEIEGRIQIKSILRMSNGISPDRDEDYRCPLFQAAEQMKANSAVHRQFSGFRNASNITRGNVLSCYRGYLSFITARDDVLKMISDGVSSADFRQIGLQPTALYITLPDDSVALGSLQGILLTQLMQELNECALQHGGRLPVRTEIYLDELCNIRPAIPMLEASLTIARSRGIRYILAIQSYAQLYGLYGTAAETIAANASTWIALNVAKDETFRNKLSQLCGNNALGQDLITPSQLSLLEYEQAIIIRERCAPYFSQLEDLSKVQQYIALVHSDLDKEQDELMTG